mgnify:CR=1 FL=1
MADNLYARLAEQFPTEAHKTLDRAGGQTYVAWNLVADRMNTVLGFQNWSFRIVREGFTDIEAWALGELTVTLDGTVTVRQQYGVSPLYVGAKQTPVDDLMKKVGTDALKKCAQTLGVALYLTDAEERREVQAAMAEQKRNAGKPAPKPSDQKPTPIKRNEPQKPPRAGLMAAYRSIAKKAIDLGHPQSGELIANKPDDMSDEKLQSIGDMLTRWVASKSERAG